MKQKSANSRRVATAEMFFSWGMRGVCVRGVCVRACAIQVWYRVIQIVINRDDVQGYAAKTVFEVGLCSSC